ncbi:hypothetical protein OIU76_006137 [Salix suchowensis]|nr:hypothetical protein OIU78_016022 [Salix suchowensis]KAJ6344551.1 hypothetical protein OIU76_006137 [Salix suchowensis]
MKFGSKKAWKSMIPLRLKGKSATRFCLFPKPRSASYGQGDTPVYLNVYDLTPMNGYAYWAGLGIFHSGVEVHGLEYAFGAHDYPTSGVFEVEPRQCPGFKFRKSIFIGTTCLDPIQVREFMEQHAASYHGDTYHLIVKNCNHFCKDICYKLTGKPIPKWVNRLAKIGTHLTVNFTKRCVDFSSLRLNNLYGVNSFGVEDQWFLGVSGMTLHPRTASPGKTSTFCNW